MKVVTSLLLLLPAFAAGGQIEGAYFRLWAESLVIERIAVRGGDALHPKAGELHTSYLDYWLRFDRGRVLVREGDVNLIDPETMDAPIEFSHEEEKGGFRVLTMVCRYREELAGVVMISLVSGTAPQRVNPGIYYSVRGPDYAAVSDALERLVLKSELRTTKLIEYRRFDESDIGAAIQPLGAFLKSRANQMPEPTSGSVTPRADARVAPPPPVAHR
jgi:hypothetical protein